MKPSPQYYFSLPLKNNKDKAIAISFAEFLKKKGGNAYYIGDALAFVSRRAPELRAAFSRTHSHKGGSTPAV
jgi:hypothetical protein